MAESPTPTPYAVRCTRGHGLVYLTPDEYDRQMSMMADVWRCPHFVGPEEAEKDTDRHNRGLIGICGAPAHFQDDIYEDAMERVQQLDEELRRLRRHPEQL